MEQMFFSLPDVVWWGGIVVIFAYYFGKFVEARWR